MKQALIVATSWMPNPLTNNRVRTLIHVSDTRKFERIHHLLRSAGEETRTEMDLLLDLHTINRRIFWALHDTNYRLKKA